MASQPLSEIDTEWCSHGFHEGAMLFTGGLRDVLDGGYVIEVRCSACERTGEVAAFFDDSDVVWDLIEGDDGGAEPEFLP